MSIHKKIINSWKSTWEPTTREETKQEKGLMFVLLGRTMIKAVTEAPDDWTMEVIIDLEFADTILREGRWLAHANYHITIISPLLILFSLSQQLLSCSRHATIVAKPLTSIPCRPPAKATGDKKDHQGSTSFLR